MKTFKYMAALLGISSVLFGCTDDGVLGEQNRGKEKPVVTLTEGKVAETEFTFTVSVSDDAGYYGVAIFPGKDNPVPDAYQLVADEVSGAAFKQVFDSWDKTSQTMTMECDPGSDFQIFAAAISETGLLSEVASLTISTPEPVFTVLEGMYEIAYKDLGDNVQNEASGQPFDMYLSLANLDGQPACLLQANWFNIAKEEGMVVNPMLVGIIDDTGKRIVFNGMFLDSQTGQIAQKNAFGAGFMYYDEAKTQMLAFWGGGEQGTDPIVMTYNEEGHPTTISYCDYTIHNVQSGEGIAIYDALTEGTITYVGPMPEAASAKASAGTINSLKFMSLDSPYFGFRR